MAKTLKDPGEAVDAALREAFRTTEARSVPTGLTDLVERLSTPGPRPDRRS